MHWQLSDKGEMILSVKGGTNYRSPAVLGPDDLGRRAHLVTVYDAAEKVVVHYLDGKPVSRQAIRTTHPPAHRRRRDRQLDHAR